jgi:hypothetical protein
LHKTAAALSVGDKLRQQDFEGDVAAKSGVERTIHDTIPPRPSSLTSV